jgi:hypothetical protein
MPIRRAARPAGNGQAEPNGSANINQVSLFVFSLFRVATRKVLIYRLYFAAFLPTTAAALRRRVDSKG